MAENDSQVNPSAFYNVFKVSLTRDQQKVLYALLPKGFSFQPFKTTRSLDEESFEPRPSKKKHTPSIPREEKDPDYSAPYVPRTPKEPPTQKVQSTPGIPGGEAFMECYLILKKLKKSVYSWPFKVPVDPKALKIPQYVNVVQQPMDLRTMEENIKKEGYKHPAEFHRDVYKMLMNSYKFNQKNSEVFATTTEFEEEYLKIVKDAKEGRLRVTEKRSINEEHQSEQIKTEQQNSMEIERMAGFSAHPPTPPPLPKPTRHYEKKKDKEKDKDKDKDKEKVKEQEKEKQKQREKDKEKYKEKEKEKEKDKDKAYEIKPADHKLTYIREKERQRDRQRERQREKARVQLEKHEENFGIKNQVKQQDFMVPSQVHFSMFDERPRSLAEKYRSDEMEAEIADQNIVKEQINDVKQSNNEDPEFQLDEHHHLKKSKSRLHQERKHREKKQNKKEKKFDVSESQNEMKEFKENNQVQSEKTMMYNQIQKKLTELLKKLGEYQIPSKGKTSKGISKADKHEHLNCTNFTTVTAADKKKLAEKISALPSSDLRYIVEIVFRNKRVKARDDQGNYEIDLQKLDGKILKQVSNFVGTRIRRLKKDTGKYKEDIKESERDHLDDMQEPYQHEVEEEEDFEQEIYPQRGVFSERDAEERRGSDSYSNLLGHQDPEHFSYHGNHNFSLEMIESEDHQQEEFGELWYK